MKERFEKTSSQVIQMLIKNDAIKIDMGLKKDEAELKRESMKREIAQLAIEREICRTEDKNIWRRDWQVCRRKTKLLLP